MSQGSEKKKKKITTTLISLDFHESDARKEFVRLFSGAQLLKIYPAKNIRIGHRLGIFLSFIWLGFNFWLVLLLYKLVIFFSGYKDIFLSVREFNLETSIELK